MDKHPVWNININLVDYNHDFADFSNRPSARFQIEVWPAKRFKEELESFDLDEPIEMGSAWFWIEVQPKGKGYGTALLNNAINLARSFDVSCMFSVADIKEKNPFDLVEWYKKFGFKVIGKTNNKFSRGRFYKNDGTIYPIISLDLKRTVKSPKSSRTSKRRLKIAQR